MPIASSGAAAATESLKRAHAASIGSELERNVENTMRELVAMVLSERIVIGSCADPVRAIRIR